MLAKAANKLAKTDDARRGLYIIDTEEKRTEALKKLPIGDVWGIGRRYEKRLTAMGVRTAYDFSVLPREWVRKNMTVVGDRLWLRDERNPLHQSGAGAAGQAGDMHVAGIRENDL